MRTDDGSLSLPGRRIVQGGATRIRQTFSAAPLLLKIVMLGALILLLQFGLAIVLPVLLLAAVGIRLEDGGPVLYRHRVIGMYGVQTDVLKLRTMVPNAVPLMRASEMRTMSLTPACESFLGIGK